MTATLIQSNRNKIKYQYMPIVESQILDQKIYILKVEAHFKRVILFKNNDKIFTMQER